MPPNAARGHYFGSHGNIHRLRWRSNAADGYGRIALTCCPIKNCTCHFILWAMTPRAVPSNDSKFPIPTTPTLITPRSADRGSTFLMHTWTTCSSKPIGNNFEKRPILPLPMALLALFCRIWLFGDQLLTDLLMPCYTCLMKFYIHRALLSSLTTSLVSPMLLGRRSSEFALVILHLGHFHICFRRLRTTTVPMACYCPIGRPSPSFGLTGRGWPPLLGFGFAGKNWLTDCSPLVFLAMDVSFGGCPCLECPPALDIYVRWTAAGGHQSRSLWVVYKVNIADKRLVQFRIF